MSKSSHASQTRFERARRKAERRKPQPRRTNSRYSVIRVALFEQEK